MSKLQTISDLNRVIHEPSRLLLITLLSTVESADFRFLLKESRLTRGNLSAHMSRLEEAGYVHVTKTFRGKVPYTEYSLTQEGKAAFDLYRKRLSSVFDLEEEN